MNHFTITPADGRSFGAAECRAVNMRRLAAIEAHMPHACELDRPKLLGARLKLRAALGMGETT